MLFLNEIFECTMCFNGTGVPSKIASLIRIVYNGIRIVVPLILIIIGMIDMAKAVTGKDEGEIKKAQNLLVKRAIAAVIVFLMLSLVTLLASIIKESDSMQCTYCLLSGEFVDADPDTEAGCVARGGEWTGICEIIYSDGSTRDWNVPLPSNNGESTCSNMALVDGASYNYSVGCWSENG